VTLPHERLDRDALAAHQGARLQELLRQVHGCNDFYTRKFEAAVIKTALGHTHGRRIEAAQRLGIGRNTITRKVQELGLEPDDDHE